MNINHLAVFHAVAEAGGVTAGAERLQISQPAVSKQVKELEAALRVALFERAGRGLRLTEPGRVLAGYARTLFALESEAERAVGQLRAVERGTLLVGASTTIGSYLLPVVLGTFYRRHPGVRVHVEVGNTERVHRDLLEYRLDVGLTEGLIPGGGLTCEVFARDELVGIVAPGHAILGREQVRAKDLAGLPFVLREPGSGTRAVIERALGELEDLAGLPFVLREPGSGTRAVIERALGELGLRVAEVMSLGSTEAIKRVVASGVGAAIVSRLAVMTEEAAGTLAVVTLSDLKIPRPLHRVRREGLTDGPTLKAFDRVLVETIPRGFRCEAAVGRDLRKLNSRSLDPLR